MQSVEIQTPTITGELQADLVDPAGNGSAYIFRHDEPVVIHAEWYLQGTFASSLGGSWRVQAQMQGSDDVRTELRYPQIPDVLALDGRTGPANPYTDDIVFPAGYFDQLLTPNTANDSIVLDVVMTLNYHDTSNNPGPMAAFVSLGKVQVYA